MVAGRYLLRSFDHAVSLAPGEVIVGRGHDCDLTLDDPLVSREHARLTVADDLLVVEDLGSRNGTVVNGERVQGAIRLDAGDRLTLGSHQFLVVDQTRDRRSRKITRQARSSGAVKRPPETLRPPPAVPPVTGSTNLFDMLLAVSERALSKGDLEEAGSSVANVLVSVRAALVRGQGVGDDSMRRLRDVCLGMAERSLEVRWLDRLFEVYTTAGRVMEAETIDRVHRTMQQLGYLATDAFTTYLDKLHGLAADLDADGRDRLTRLEELRRTAS